MSGKWNELIGIFNRNEACAEFVAEALYAYLMEYGEGKDDEDFAEELIQLLGGDSCEIPAIE
jgi:hypothetical protein